MPDTVAPPEHNVTGHDYGDRAHLSYRGPIIDLHSHVMQTRPTDPPIGPPIGTGPGASIEQAELMLDVGREFGIVHTSTMCPPDDIVPLRDRFGDRLSFIGMMNKKKRDEPDDEAYRMVDRFLSLGIIMVKLWSAPRGRERGLFVNAPWRIEAVKRARDAGIRHVMVHVADPEVWFKTVYADAAKFDTKPGQYVGLEEMMTIFADMTWIGAHMAGDPEHPDHLQDLLERFPQFHIDTSATKWQVREVSPRRLAIHDLICRFPDRFLFGTDLVTRHHLVREHYVSRYWCQRTLWESDWQGRSPIADPDYQHEPNQPTTPLLCGVHLPPDVLKKVYFDNAAALLSQTRIAPKITPG